MRVKQLNHTCPLQSGAAIIETCLVCIPLWLVCALVLELTNSQSVRQIAQLALYEAARTGSVTGAHPEKIEQTFRQAILPLFVPAGAHDSPAARRDTSAQKFFHATGLSLWRIETINPDAAVYIDFADPVLSRQFNRPTLRNDYLAEQHETQIKKGWQDGRGPASGQTVFNANTLHLQLSLFYRPRTPGIAFILKRLGAHRTDRTGLGWQKGYLEAKLGTEVMMQSHAQQWNAIKRTDGEAGRQVASKGIDASVSGKIQQYPMGINVTTHPQSARLVRTEQSTTPDTMIAHTGRETTQKNARADRADSHAIVKENELCNGLLCCH